MVDSLNLLHIYNLLIIGLHSAKNNKIYNQINILAIYKIGFITNILIRIVLVGQLSLEKGYSLLPIKHDLLNMHL